ncbi:MAG: urea ABC transporter permease subunit UrtB [Pseudomonadota bacterium]
MKAMARLVVMMAMIIGWVAPAGADELAELIQAFAQASDYDDTEALIAQVAATGDGRAAPVLEALEGRDLVINDADGRIVLAVKDGRRYSLLDPLSQEVVAEDVGSRDFTKLKVNNRIRRAVRSAMGTLTLRNPDPNIRLAAAAAIFTGQDTDAIEPLEIALEAEDDPGVRSAMREARAAALLNTDAGEADKLDAIQTLEARGDRDALSILLGINRAEASPLIVEATEQAIDRIQRNLQLWDIGQNLWYGLSLGSVLLLAAIGLAITFGVMGVINMAHGEMVMLGAYTTFVVQEIIRQHAPGLFDTSLLIAIPLAFLVAGCVGILIERSVIRHLYGRPLETLLATWGISLVLQQTVRTIFGPTNREVGNPSWMSGAFEVGQMAITYSRLWTFVFAIAVFLGLILILRATRFGLEMRAVTQNRRMAASMGIATTRVDALTFGLGSGIAGLAGVAISQLDNVSPNLGQGYIIDSFMVVVFGGVGNLWGTITGAMTLGLVNKLLEPYAGAVLGKILVLVGIILFIQKRPRGLFALRGRAIET